MMSGHTKSLCDVEMNANCIRNVTRFPFLSEIPHASSYTIVVLSDEGAEFHELLDDNKFLQPLR